MTTWNDRLLPHPLLAPWTDDYTSETFTAQVPHAVLNNGEQINLTVKYHLTSAALRELVAEGKAQYVGLVACAKTFGRNSYATNQEDDIYILDATEYAEEVKLTPYVVSTQPIQGFLALEHNDEIKQLKPNGFDIPAGSILAVGNSTDVTLEEGGSPFSVIDLVADPNVDVGIIKVELDDNRLKVHMAPPDKSRTEALRMHGQHSTEMAILHPAIYLHAVTEALRNLPDHSHRRWAQTMRKALERNGIDADDELIQSDPLTYAQALMEKPVGTMMTALDREEE